MKKFKHVDVKTIEEAVSILDDYAEKARVVAGGTDLLGELKERNHPEQPEVVVNLKTIPDLSYIREDAEGLKIGALTTLSEIEADATVQTKYPALAEAARKVAYPQIRNMGTIGGNLLQHSRCWYYRADNNHFYCLRKGGVICYAIAGDNRYNAIVGGEACYAVSPSDTATALTALDAKVKVTGPGGERTIAVKDLYTVLGFTLEPKEILTEVQVPLPPAGSKQAFLKFSLRAAINFAIVNVATVLMIEAGSVTDARIVLGAVAPFPYRATEAEDALKGKTISEATATAAADAAVVNAMPLTMNAYKTQITKALVKRAILS